MTFNTNLLYLLLSLVTITVEVSANLSSNIKGHVLRGEKHEIILRAVQSPVLGKSENIIVIRHAVKKLGCSNASFAGTDRIHDNRPIRVDQPVVSDEE